MGDNLQWIFGAFGIAWVIHILYLSFIFRKERRLEKQIQQLRELLNARETEREVRKIKTS